MAKSPSITILERDMSAYTVTSSDTVLAIVGYATKGPIGIPTIVTSRADFNEKFGTAVKGSPYAAMAAYRAFNQGNKIIFDRVAIEADTDAENPKRAKEAAVVSHNPTGITSGKQTLDLGSTTITGLTSGESYGVSIAVDGDSPIEVAIDATDNSGDGEITVADFKTAIETALGSSVTTSVTGAVITITSASSGDSSSIRITDSVTANNLLDVNGVSVGTATDGTTSGDGTDNVMMIAIEKGSSTNLISVTKSSRTNPVTSDLIHKIEIFYDGILKETYDDVSLTVADENYFEKVINLDPDNGGSKYINIVTEDKDDASVVTFDDGTFYLGQGDTEKTDSMTSISDYDYILGTDGFDSSSSAQSSNEGLFIDQLTTDGELGNTEAFDYHILITPDMPEQSVQDAAISLAEFREDFLYIADPPMGLDYKEVADWHNGDGGHGRISALGSSYAVTYWSWLKDYNIDTKEYVWCPPSVFIAEKLMEVDRTYGPWFAPAGDTRGKLNASDYEASPSFSQRELLYGDFNAVNPIVNFVSKGLEIYGQKTLLRENSSLNRINVRRMIIFAKKLIKKALEKIVFEPHNPDSWRRASNLITSILEPIRQSGGIDQYAVIVDSSVNTPDIIAQNIMKGTIKIIPTNTIEIVEITMQVNKAGASLTE